MSFEDDGLQAWHHHEELLQQQHELEQSRLVFLNIKESKMSLIASDPYGDRKYENAPSGAYVARCFRVVDLGTQTFSVGGETKQAHQCLITWELSKLMDSGKPFTISEKYTISLNEKARLRAVLESWRGRKFTDVERKGFDLKNVLGKVCFINIVHAERGSKSYANVASVMPVPDGIVSPAPVNELAFYAIGDHDEKVFDSLPKYYREMIQRSPEFQLLRQKAPVINAEEEFADDIPF
jgi:hypothetical protein